MPRSDWSRPLPKPLVIPTVMTDLDGLGTRGIQLALEAAAMLFTLKLAGVFLAISLFVGANIPADASSYVVTLDEVGSNVVATGSGQIDLTNLSLVCGPPCNSEPGLNAVGAFITTGAPNSFGVPIDLYSGVSGPTSFGSNVSAEANSGSGDLVGVQGNAHDLYLSAGYISDGHLSDSATYNNATFASLGVIPGTYVWTWDMVPIVSPSKSGKRRYLHRYHYSPPASAA